MSKGLYDHFINKIVQYDDGTAHSVTLESENDYVHIKFPNSPHVICISGDGEIDINGIPMDMIEKGGQNV